MNINFQNIIPLICLSLASCSFVPNEMKTAEQLLESRPDSALSILQNIKQQNIKFDSNRALYGLLMFQALDKNNKTLTPDSLINFSIEYYQKRNYPEYLAKCYFYKGRMFMHLSKYEDATLMYLKVLDYKSDVKGDLLLGKLYSDLGNICYYQHEYENARDKFTQSANYFNNSGKETEAKYRLLDVGRTYFAEKNYKTALHYYLQILAQSKDSELTGVTLQEIGVNYFYENKFDSSKLYLRKSLHYPSESENKGKSFFALANLYFSTECFDSAYYYSALALKEPVSFVTKRECYRILVDVEYARKNIIQMGKFMTLYQSYLDSIKKIESQTKSTVIENLHDTTQEAKGIKQSTSFIISILVIILFISALTVYFLYKRNKEKKSQLEVFKHQLKLKQEFVSQELSEKIKDAKIKQANVRKHANPEEKLLLDKELYTSILHLNSWEAFKSEMNQTFDMIVDKLESDYSGITKREIIWCCLQLLEIPNTDRMLLLDATPDSLYKLKQRLAKKINLNSTKELDSFLIELISTHN